MTTRPLAVLAFSGGMDSTTLAAHYRHRGYELLLLSFDYGQRNVRELEAARRIARHYAAEHHIVDLATVGALLPGSALTDRTVPLPTARVPEEARLSTVVPNRNAILANIAVAVASARRAALVALGIQAGDRALSPDCRPDFLDALRRCVTAALDGFPTPAVEAPFLGMGKAEVARIADALGAPLALSWSCFQGGELHCGECGPCVKRHHAMTEAGITDPTAYETEFWKETA
ncbi:7-cyano-7-deazaguanine synthase QueC [Streptomyces sp. URMC 126]|uniref:7-cyano-7-deazaguanine synthase QueC n=1 Tax=Streptomyces sp. URMC 126 TaxID=3423401 RepID=UPI003F1DD774